MPVATLARGGGVAGPRKAASGELGRSESNGLVVGGNDIRIFK
jgi:hypothetical protein